ncbi:hypothetical protein L1887_23935 [Cichorium endivia]|nr:hypothetical protein L1887_23935 [Cichorium endivia]
MDGPSKKRTKTIANKKKKSTRRQASSPSPEPSPILPDFWEVQFVDQQHRTRFDNFAGRSIAVQKFAHIDSLRDLHILDGVQMMFQHIGWGRLITLHAPSYDLSSREILSSLVFENDMLSFRLVNRDFHIHVDEIADLIGQDLSATFDPFSIRLNASILSQGWYATTGIREFKASSAKASSIVHPVLKTVHRILASVVFPREELGTVTAIELQLLMHMIGNPQKKPHFGRCVAHRLQRIARSNTGQIHCGGLLTLIIQSPYIGLQFSPEVPIVPGGHFLTTTVLEAMHLFKRFQGGHQWATPSLHDASDLWVFSGNAHQLDVNPDDSEMDWLMNAILYPDPATRRPIRVPPSMGDAGPSSAPSSSHHAEGSSFSVDDRLSRIEENLSGLRTDYQALNTNYHTLHTEVQTLNTNYQSLNTHLTTFHDEYTTNWGAQQKYWDQQTKNWEAQQKQYQDMYSMFQGWTLNPPQFPPPPPPEN